MDMNFFEEECTLVDLLNSKERFTFGNVKWGISLAQAVKEIIDLGITPHYAINASTNVDNYQFNMDILSHSGLVSLITDSNNTLGSVRIDIQPSQNKYEFFKLIYNLYKDRYGRATSEFIPYISNNSSEDGNNGKHNRFAYQSKVHEEPEVSWFEDGVRRLKIFYNGPYDVAIRYYSIEYVKAIHREKENKLNNFKKLI